MQKKCYAVMGNPVEHSLSPFIHQAFARQVKIELIYEKININLPDFAAQVRDFFRAGGNGLNITLPCKQQAFTLAHIATQRCQTAKAANTLWMQNGALHADNTDGIGLIRDLQRHMDVENKKILLLGAGGAARGIIGNLLAANPARFVIANRTFAKAEMLSLEFPLLKPLHFNELDEGFDLIINSTAASLEGSNIALPPVVFSTKPLCYDLAYQAHGQTPFVMWAVAQQCEGRDGLGMLVEQAAEAFYIWHGVKPATKAVLEELRSRQVQRLQ
ncbi:shikimate dehydrogenase [Legionella sp. 27cVA30]|uniref:shikimate dehydrogenase n=1 Tax=Legionella TaxID=445 RepID=UPI000F8F281E|nr:MULTISPECIES: shikimate dehydrogenase [Legionella]MCP0912810.1 shikimate dehydrogenase [Legionella sp. 27cVA30]RUR16299.1 shikimate dehydrogenase [Legionella septentrionalis]